ncbi:MAG: hypothetical protein A2X36_16665 [Elusimicrobia bacterium GWA2_69_24]|nr:MAG: hypothetical protein A2X36_16665 [Elusimicrobia bacterium GWA2_69_24]
MPSNILIIEDDPAFRKQLAKLLESRGFAVRAAATGKSGMSEAFRTPPDLVVLDLVLPGIGGTQVCRALKDQVGTAGVPILILTGEDQEGQEVACLDMGADDYLIKPVQPERLLAHCRALLRRSQPSPEAARLEARVGAMTLDYAGKLVQLAGRRISHLTPKEFGILYDLAVHSPHPRDRTSLYKDVWGMDPPSEGSLKTVEVHVRRIRLKMAWSPEQWLITVESRGYSLIPPS